MSCSQGALAPPSVAGRSSRRTVVAAVVGAVASVALGAFVASHFSTAYSRAGSAATSEAAVSADGLLHPAGRQSVAAAGMTTDPKTAAMIEEATAVHVEALPPLPLPQLFTLHRGFFNLYTGKGNLHGRVLLEVPASALDVPFLLTTLVTASDTQVLSPGRPFWFGSGSYEKKVMAFRRSAGAASALDLYRPLMDLRSEGKADRKTSFPAAGYWGGWLQTFAVRDLAADAYLVDITEWVREGMNEVTDMALQDEDKWATVTRRFVDGTAHDRSVELDVEVRLREKKPPTLHFSPENWMAVRVRHSIIPLPAQPMEPRSADHRFGFFSSSFVATDDISGTRPKRSFINRWDLSKGPVTFLIDPSTPTKWRPAVKAGLVEWNKAFAAAGHPDALVGVLPGDANWPSDYAHGDGRHNTIYWASGEAAGYATGTMEVDPRSGQIARAHIVLTNTFLGRAAQLLRAVVEPDEVGMAGNRPAGAAPWKPVANVTIDEVRGQMLKDLTMHEAGHVLGLRHNFRGSSLVPLSQFADSAAVAAQGLTGSVMDYNSYCIRADKADQTATVYTPTVGRYDMAAIFYGYANFDSAADRVAFARKTAADGVTFCTDDDNPGLSGADPYCTRWDTSGSPLAFANESISVALGAMAAKAAAAGRTDGASWLDASRDMTRGLSRASYQLQFAAKWVGGVVPSRDDSDGDGGSVRPVTPIDGATQAAALAMIVDALDPVRGFLGAATATAYGPLLVTRTCGRGDDGERFPEAPGSDCLGVEPEGVVAALRSYRARVVDAVLHPARLGRLTDARAAGAVDVPSIGTVLRRMSSTLLVAPPDDGGDVNDVAADAGVQWVQALAAIVTGGGRGEKTAHHPAAVGAAAAELRRIHAAVAGRADAASVGLAVLLKEFAAAPAAGG